MGIPNLTPDSFYDGGKYKDESSALKHVEKMIDEAEQLASKIDQAE
jgi:dihydropteroate synthase